jgi:hypothetical protein
MYSDRVRRALILGVGYATDSGPPDATLRTLLTGMWFPSPSLEEGVGVSGKVLDYARKKGEELTRIWFRGICVDKESLEVRSKIGSVGTAGNAGEPGVWYEPTGKTIPTDFTSDVVQHMRINK